jgi:hypothetical protein
MKVSYLKRKATGNRQLKNNRHQAIIESAERSKRSSRSIATLSSNRLEQDKL